MRAALAISAVIHAAILLWLVLAPAVKPFDPAYAKAILVELIPPPDEPNAAEGQPPKPVTPNPDSAKSDSTKPPTKPEPAAADAKTPPQKRPAGGADDAGETAARLAWMLDTLPNLAAPPSEDKTALAADLIAKFKAQVRKCFVPLADPPGTPDFATEIRIALKPNGTLAADPEMTFAPAAANGRVLMERAKEAVRQCQPYGFLPTEKYADWRIIDLVFSYDGPADDASANAVRQKIFSNR